MFSQNILDSISTYTRKGGEMSNRLQMLQKASCSAGGIHEILVEQEKKDLDSPVDHECHGRLTLTMWVCCCSTLSGQIHHIIGVAPRGSNSCSLRWAIGTRLFNHKRSCMMAA